MNAPDVDLYTLWQKFRARWPLDELASMTLDEYVEAKSTDSFTYWLMQTTKPLGKIGAGPMFKLGIFARGSDDVKADSAARKYSEGHAWYRRFGVTAEEAFETVRAIVCDIARAASRGDFEAVERIKFGEIIKWKIAFLYQDPESPGLLNIFSADLLRAYLQQPDTATMVSLQQDVMAQRGDRDLFAFQDRIFKLATEALAARPLRSEDAYDYLAKQGERFRPINKTRYIAGFHTEGGELAVEFGQKDARMWAEPGPWLEEVRSELGDITVYPAGLPRNPNLDRGAPRLAPAHEAVYFTVPTKAALELFCDAYTLSTLQEDMSTQVAATEAAATNIPLNQILFGPPGTGKTYATIDEALRILAPDYAREHRDDRAALKARFDQFVATGHVRFVTFHQSFSYEDFVEGLRAEANEDKELNYVIEPGVFKRLCDDARTDDVLKATGLNSESAVWKISIDGSGMGATKRYCLDHDEIRIGWGETGDLALDGARNPYWKALGAQNQGTLAYFSSEMQDGDIVLCLDTADTIGAIGVVAGAYRYEEHVPAAVIKDYQHVRKVRWLYQGLKLPIAPVNGGKKFVQKTVYRMGRLSWGTLATYLEQQGILAPQAAAGTDPYVLIIDEINRGNISRIFGELITLVEPSKRAGGDETLTAVLPYSKTSFSVPSNVYLLGTMNTADRSLASMDIALRRRFTFKELPPKPELLAGIVVEKDGVSVPVDAMLRTMNERIAFLLDREHCIGHAYFIPLKTDRTFARLRAIFRDQILPLLQEYFFEDWEHIALVLNDQNKPEGEAFVYSVPADLERLFGPKRPDNVGQRETSWQLDEKAFDRIASYHKILGNLA